MPILRLATCKLIVRSPRFQHVAEGNDRESDQRWKQRHARRQSVEELVTGRRNEIFFGQELERIGDQSVHQPQTGETENRCAVGADTVLNQRAAFALDPAQGAGEIEHHDENQRGFKRNNREIDDHVAVPPPLPNSAP